MTNGILPWNRALSRRDGDSVATPVSQMRWDWDRMFDRFLDDFWGSTARPAQEIALDVSETDEELRVRAEVPGVPPKDLDVQLAGDVLTIAGHKVDEEEVRQDARSYSERRFGTFQRALRLPCPVDPGSIRARHEHGVVTITMQKAEAVRPKRIQVKSA